MKRKYKPRTGLGKLGDRILESILIKDQDTTFRLGFKPTRKDYQVVIVQRREGRRAKATRQTPKAQIKIPHL